ncbi:hypothetical protein HDU67_002372, partial [Dinochytrium kinnereticum]
PGASALLKSEGLSEVGAKGAKNAIFSNGSSPAKRRVGINPTRYLATFVRYCHKCGRQPDICNKSRVERELQFDEEGVPRIKVVGCSRERTETDYRSLDEHVNLMRAHKLAEIGKRNAWSFVMDELVQTIEDVSEHGSLL